MILQGITVYAGAHAWMCPFMNRLRTAYVQAHKIYDQTHAAYAETHGLSIENISYNIIIINGLQ